HRHDRRAAASETAGGEAAGRIARSAAHSRPRSQARQDPLPEAQGEIGRRPGQGARRRQGAEAQRLRAQDGGEDARRPRPGGGDRAAHAPERGRDAGARHRRISERGRQRPADRGRGELSPPARNDRRPEHPCDVRCERRRDGPVRSLRRSAGNRVPGRDALHGEVPQRPTGKTEEEIYAKLGPDWIPPELREARGEITLAREHRLPRLVELTDIRGDLQMHTSATDGKGTIDEMAHAARALGYEYVAITDHSKRVTMALGFDAKRLREQWKTIDEWNATSRGFTILKSIELDILENGKLDLPDDALAE